jgi:hypothetical protein
VLVVPKKRDKDGSRGFCFVRLEVLHGRPQETKCVILWAQVACVLMTGCRCSDGVCDPSFVAQSIVRCCGGQHDATVVRYLGGVNEVLPASSSFLIRFGQRSVQAVSANIYRVANIFVKICLNESHAFRRSLNEFYTHFSHLWSNVGELSVRNLYVMLWRICEFAKIGALQPVHLLLA